MVEKQKHEDEEEKQETEELKTLVNDQQHIQTHNGSENPLCNDQQQQNKTGDSDTDDLEKWSKISETESVRRFKNIVILIVLTGLTVVNYVVPNVKLVLKYSEVAENNRYVRMTLAYIIAPIFITTLVNLAWYIDDDLLAKDLGKKRATRKTWWIRILSLVFQMGTVLRYFQSLLYGYKSKHSTGSLKAKYTQKMVVLERDATLLRSFTSFMQGAPQFALQLYIVTEGPSALLEDGIFWQMFSVVSCLATISWATVSCDRVLSSSTPQDMIADWRIIILLLPWRLLFIASRMTILALFSTLFPLHFGLGCVAHYLIMYAFIQRQKVTTSQNGTRGEVFLFLVGGLVYIVTDLLVKYDRSFHKYVIYYGIAFIEGLIMMSVWYVYTDIRGWYRDGIVIGVSASFCLAMAFLRLYYEYVHPDSRACFYSQCCKNKMKVIDALEKVTKEDGDVDIEKSRN